MTTPTIPYTCPDCSMVFTSNASLLAHLRKAHKAGTVSPYPFLSSILIRLPSLPPREAWPNRFEGRHWSSRSGIKAAMKAEIVVMAKQAFGGKPPPHFEKAHITWTFHSPRGNYDGDNVLAACKGWCDGLVAAGIIVNDTISRVSHSVRWERAKKEETVIEVKEV